MTKAGDVLAALAGRNDIAKAVAEAILAATKENDNDEHD